MVVGALLREGEGVGEEIFSVQGVVNVFLQLVGYITGKGPDAGGYGPAPLASNEGESW